MPISRLPLSLFGVFAMLAPAAVAFAAKAAPESEPPPIPVRIAAAEVRDIPRKITLAASLRAKESIDLRARVEGVLTEIGYQDGQLVEQGAVLFRIDPKPFEARLAAARAGVARAEAARLKARRDVERLEPLAQTAAVPRQDLDFARAALEVAAADVAAAEADVALAEINLSYTTITAPVTGRVGAAAYSVGSVVGRPDTTLLATLTVSDPILAEFSLAERDYLAYRRAMEEAGERFDSVRADLVLADGSDHAHPGVVEYLDPVFDSRTGTLLVRTSFPNPEHLLRPGQFARVRLTKGVDEGRVVIPSAALGGALTARNVFVVDENGVANPRPVTTGPSTGDAITILDGLEGGERIVVAGRERLRPGARVTDAPPRPADAPES